VKLMDDMQRQRFLKAAAELPELLSHGMNAKDAIKHLVRKYAFGPQWTARLCESASNALVLRQLREARDLHGRLQPVEIVDAEAVVSELFPTKEAEVSTVPLAPPDFFERQWSLKEIFGTPELTKAPEKPAELHGRVEALAKDAQKASAQLDAACLTLSRDVEAAEKALRGKDTSELEQIVRKAAGENGKLLFDIFEARNPSISRCGEVKTKQASFVDLSSEPYRTILRAANSIKAVREAALKRSQCFERLKSAAANFLQTQPDKELAVSWLLRFDAIKQLAKEAANGKQLRNLQRQVQTLSRHVQQAIGQQQQQQQWKKQLEKAKMQLQEEKFKWQKEEAKKKRKERITERLGKARSGLTSAVTAPAKKVLEAIMHARQTRREQIARQTPEELAAEIFTPEHEREMTEIQQTLVLARLFADPILRSYPPEDVVAAYNQLAMLNPDLALSAPAALSFVRQLLESQYLFEPAVAERLLYESKQEGKK